MMYQTVATRLIRFLTLAVVSATLIGCGQGSGPEPVPGTPQVPQTGLLIDAPVEGVSWESSSGNAGVTNAMGEFQYLSLETITFKIGDIVLGSVEGAPIVTVVELTNSVSPTTQAATNQLVFLQSLDSDGDLTNGINISAATVAAAAGKSIDFTADDFGTNVVALIADLMGPDATVVSEADALNHFYQTYADMGGTDTFGFLFPGYPPVGGGLDTFELVFADEFDSGTAPDSAIWNIETGYGPNNDGWGNNEWQLYTNNPENVRVEEGNLVIEARCDEPPCGSRDGTITSGRITTQNKFNFKFGKVVARIKPPVGTGSWPAFWALGSNIPQVGWPSAGEIDFMEMFAGLSNSRTTHSTLHWCDETIQAPDPCTFPNGRVLFSESRAFATSLGDDFHIWEADWNEDRITVSIDGATYFSRTIDVPTMDEFLKEFFMILNVAMGGSLGSNNQPPSGAEMFPQTMLVDYVRVFQQVGGGTVSSQTIDFEDDPATYDFGESGGFGGGAAAVIDNPVAEGINTSAQVGRMLKFNGEVFAGSKLTLPTPIAVTSGSTFTMKVWSPREVPVLFKIEGPSEVERSVTHSGSGWEELTFDFGSFSGSAEAITLIFDLGTAGDAENDPDNWTFYFDDITFNPSSGGGNPGGSADFPIDFEDGAETYNFGVDGGFGGGAAAVIPNPVAEGINTSSQVARMLKFSGEVFAGSLLQLPSPLQVTPNSSFTMKVWSPRPVMVLFKLEGEVESELNVAHGGTGWEELTYDFGSFSGSVEGLTFIFDLGIVGDATGDPDNWTFYFDDIVYNQGDGGSDPGGDPDSFGGDFEAAPSSYDFGVDGGFGGGAAEVLANPVAGGINTSSQVVRMLKFAGEVFAGSKWTLGTPLDVEAGSMFSMKVWSPRPVMVLLKLEGPVEAEINLAHTGTGWEELTYDFSSFSGSVEGLTVIFDLGIVGDAEGDPNNWTFYFDDITLIPPGGGGGPGGGLSQIDLPITFDDETVDYSVVDFGSPVAAMTMLVVDPEDSNNMVASTTKAPGAPVWAGTTMSTTDGLATAIPFSVDETTIGVRVYSPDAGIPVRLKADNIVGGTISVETEQLTTVANAWETLVFDFADNVADTPALDLDVSYRALSIFFNFGTSGDDAGLKTYLWDDVEFGVEPAGDMMAPMLTSVSISSDNADSSLAKAGDVVTVAFTADEPVLQPTVTIAGASATAVTGSDTMWQATRTLAANDTEGAVAFAIAFSDVAGNAGTAVTQSTDASSVTFDATSPMLSISGLSDNVTSLDPITVTFEFDEDVTGFELGDIAVTNGAASDLASTDAATYTATITPAGEGELTVTVAAEAAQDGAGNLSAEASAVAQVDTIAPAVTISGVPADLTTLNPITVTFQFSEIVSGFELIDIVVTNGSASDFAIVDGTTYTAVVTPDGVGDLSVSVAAGAALDAAGNGSLIASDAISQIDVVAPTVTISGVPASFDTLDPIAVTIQFSEAVSGFDASDIQVTNGSVSGFVAVDADTYTADVTPDGGGDLNVAVAADAAQDGVGNGNTAATDAVSAIDAVDPTLVISGAPTEFTTLGAIGLTFQFSEAVTGFDVSDIQVTNGAASAFTVVSDDTYTADVTPTGAGDLTIAVAAGAATDGVGNTSAAATDVVVTNNLDTEAPLLTVISIASNNANPAYATTGDVVTLSLTANEDIVQPVVTINGVAADAVTGAGTTWQATRAMTVADAESAVVFTVNFEDLDNNMGPESTVTTDASSVTFDITAPTVAINGLPATFEMLDPLGATFQFSEDVTGFDASDVSVTNGSVSAFMSVDASTYTANLTPDGAGNMTVSIAAGAAQDLAGLQSVMPADIVVSDDVDVQAPTLTTVSIASDNTDTTLASPGNVVTVSITADEDIVEPTVTIGGLAAAVTGAGTTWSASRAMTGADAEGAIAFAIDFEDLVGNTGTQVVATTDASAVEFDSTGPTLAITGLAASFTTLDPIAVTFTFSEDVNGFAIGDLAITNGSADTLVTVDAQTYTTNVTPDGNGDLTVAVADDVVTDDAGNNNTGSSETSTSDLPPTWQLVWSDDFDGVALDAANWTARTDVDCPAPCDGVQSYNTNNVSVAGGVLTLQAQENAGPAYVSGLIDSRGKRELKYGRVEIDARMPGTQGSAPALMLLPASDTYGAWPLSGEIDIATAPNLGVGGNVTLEQSLVYGLPSPEQTKTTGTYASPAAPDANFITYALEWEEGEIRWFVDDVHVLTQTQANWYTYTEDADGVYGVGAGAAPFDEDFYLTLALAVGADTDVSSSFPQSLEIDAVRVFECANATDPAAGTGCSTADPGVMPVVAPGAPDTNELQVYIDATGVITLDSITNTLVAGSTGDVTSSDTNVADGGNTLWNVAVDAVGSSGDVFIGSQDFSADPLADTGFNIDGAEAAGELLFDMRVNAATAGTTLTARLDSGAGNAGSVAIPLPGDTEWSTYSIKVADMLNNQSGSGLDLTNVVNLFGLVVADGTADIDLDNIRVKVACRDAGTCDPAARATVAEYVQDFEALDPTDSAALSGDGWLVGGNVFSPDGMTFLFNYFSFPAPNGGPAFSAVAEGQGGAPQGVRVLSVYNDYNNTTAHNAGNRVEANVFQERTITADDIGKTFYFSFDAKRGNINDPTECASSPLPPCDTTAQAFFKVINPMAGFSLTVSDELDTTDLPTNWDRYTLSLTLTDASFVGQLLQYGYFSVASGFEPSGVFYDNIEIRSSAAAP